MKATCLCCAVLCLLTAPAYGESKNRKLAKELGSAYKQWLDADVKYIITDEERTAFNRLQNDDEREQFVEQFWLRRDPTPDTTENEYKEEHYRRIAYANERYASGIAGWRTDRGRIYITYGAPDEIESHPTGGPYERTPEQGGGSSVAYAHEIWRYRYIADIGTNIVLEFVDASGTGEYRLALDPEEKDATAHVPGSAASSRANSFLPNDSRKFERLDQYVKVNRPPAVKFRDLEALVNVQVRYNALPMQVHADFLRVTETTALVPVTVQFNNTDLEFSGPDGATRAIVNLYLRVTSLARRTVSVAEDVVKVEGPNPGQSAMYQKAFYLAPGTYRLNVVAKDLVAGRTNNYEMALRVPQFDPEQWSASSLILADRIEPVAVRDVSAGQFVLGDAKVRPRISASFRKNEKLGIYLQVYQPGQAKPEGTVRYKVVRSGAEAPLFDYSEPLTGPAVEHLLPLSQSKIPPGAYSLRVTIQDKSERQVLLRTAAFRIE